MSSRYNYVILGSDWDLYTISFSDAIKKENVVYIPGIYPPKATIRGLLYRVHFHPFINKIINLPFKKLWNSSYFENRFSDGKPLCFIFFNDWIEIDTNLVDDFKRIYPNSKFVWVSFDLMKTHKFRFSAKAFDVKKIKEYFDLSLSYDKNDCEKYNLTYHPLVFSIPTELNDIEVENDIYFLGKAKDRYKDIISMFEVFRSKDLKCDFNIVGVPKEEQLYQDEISYISGMDYMENLRHVKKSRCLLEVMQGGGSGFTQRICEAVCLNKKAITNNPLVKEEPFFNDEYISIFYKADELDGNFVESIRDNTKVNYNYSDKMSPIELLEFIENKLL